MGTRHERGEVLARLRQLHGATESAREFLDSAAEQEQQCADATGDDEPRSKGIIRVGAVSSWMQSARLEAAEALAKRYLMEPILPGYYRELHKLLNDNEARIPCECFVERGHRTDGAVFLQHLGPELVRRAATPVTDSRSLRGMRGPRLGTPVSTV